MYVRTYVRTSVVFALFSSLVQYKVRIGRWFFTEVGVSCWEMKDLLNVGAYIHSHCLIG